MLGLFALYRDFHQFPFQGTILEQPARMIDAFRIFQTEIEAVRGPEHSVTATELIDIMAAFYGTKR